MICNCIVSSAIISSPLITPRPHHNLSPLSSSDCSAVFSGEGVNTWVISALASLSALFMSGWRCLTVSHLIWPRQPGDVSWSVSDSRLSSSGRRQGRAGQVSSNNTRNQSPARERAAEESGQQPEMRADKPSPPTLMTDAQMPQISQSYHAPSYIFSPKALTATPNKETPGEAVLADPTWT